MPDEPLPSSAGPPGLPVPPGQPETAAERISRALGLKSAPDGSPAGRGEAAGAVGSDPDHAAG